MRPAVLTRYEAAHLAQLDLVGRRRSGDAGDVLLLLEHHPVITLGRNADAGGVLAGNEVLRARGIDVHRVERGGQATYHGPGQLVAYPIFDLRALGGGVARFVHRLEETMVRTAAAFGVEASPGQGVIGVFAGGAKIGAVGVRVTRGVT
ncbi:MAG: lipoyl(octanoyl) transferase LipB [Deltaproteobacteria bacterium]|nr:lipoyl(octanoyl) transferase LipB [Deltaproteobacteria bacterium]